MGQSGSKAARSMRLPRTPTATTKPPTSSKPITREQMLAEEPESDSSARLQDNLKYFLNPKELVTPITPQNPSENMNVQALRNRRKTDEDAGVKSQEIAQMLRALHGKPQSQAAGLALDKDTVQKLQRFLDPL
ncbi:hypothetical protein LPJ63_004099 [Coemansia sp. RSA 2711]|nr:hypothetical protein LPJ63_004099 [Coemansia sp. RSA 2711]